MYCKLFFSVYLYKKKDELLNIIRFMRTFIFESCENYYSKTNFLLYMNKYIIIEIGSFTLRKLYKLSIFKYLYSPHQWPKSSAFKTGVCEVLGSNPVPSVVKILRSFCGFLRTLDFLE